jgi:hypothetical protein
MVAATSAFEAKIITIITTGFLFAGSLLCALTGVRFYYLHDATTGIHLGA